MTNVVITDPVNNEINREEGEFQAMWEQLGHEIRNTLKDGPAETTWCNIGVTHEADTVGHCIMHRTVSLG